MVEILVSWPKHIISYDTTNLKNVVKFYIPTWSIFANATTYLCTS